MVHPEEFITIPIKCETQITKNNKVINQDWHKNEVLNTILNTECNIKDVGDFVGLKKPVKFELRELKRTLSN